MIPHRTPHHSTTPCNPSPMSSLNLFHSLAMDVINSRRLLLHSPFHNPPSDSSLLAAGPTSSAAAPGNNFDANVVMILAVLLCALICALGLNSIVRCAFRCSNRITLEPEAGPVGRPRAGVRKALRSLPTQVYTAGLKLPGAGPECAICLSDFAPGERVRVLPKCGHGFHVRCVDRWLLARPSCPTCRQCLLSSCHKASSCDEVSRPGMAQVFIVPLEHEGLVAAYR